MTTNEELRRLDKERTQGPYEVVEYDEGYMQIETRPLTGPSLCVFDNDAGTHVRRNAAYIVAACNELPRLLDEADALKEQNVELDSYVQAYQTQLAATDRCIEALKQIMRDAEEMLRHPRDPFVMVNTANLLNQTLASVARAAEEGNR